MGRELFCFNFLRKQGYNGRNEERVHAFVSLLCEKVCESLRKSGWDERVNGNSVRACFLFFFFFLSFFLLLGGIDAEQTHVHGRHTYDEASSFLARRRETKRENKREQKLPRE